MKKWLKKNGWVKPLNRGIKKSRGKTQSKSSLFFVKKDNLEVSKTSLEMFEEIETVEKLMLEAQQEKYKSTKTA